MEKHRKLTLILPLIMVFLVTTIVVTVILMSQSDPATSVEATETLTGTPDETPVASPAPAVTGKPTVTYENQE